jgi:hypothetical protein
MKRVLYFSLFMPLFMGIHSSLFCQNAPIVVNYSYEPAVQHFNVPPGVSTLTITISGAHGAGALGGKGASFTGICNIISPHILSVAVGQEGTTLLDTNAWSWGGGGGGASWVYDSNVVLYNPLDNTGLIAVAAGGGGAGCFALFSVPFQGWQHYAGGDGGIDLSTNAATVGTYSDSGAIGGNGGSVPPYAIFTAGGAGWLSNGMGWPGLFGMDEANHFTNSNCNYCNIAFGGGGGSWRYNEAGNDGFNGGGGGGYNGGGAGSGGGGGGSYLNGTLVGNATASNTGNGSVSISYIPPLTQVIDIYPNPNSGVFIVNGIRQEQLIEIYNVLGEKVYSQPFTIHNSQFTIDLSSQPSGIYFYRILNENSGLVGEGKVIVQK